MPISLGMDVGQAHDHSVLVVMEQLGEHTPAFVRYVHSVSLRTPFQEQQAIARIIVKQTNADIAVIDNTGIGRETGERLQFTLPCTVWRFDFTETTKSELLGIAYSYFTDSLVKCHPKHRQLLKEFQNIKREMTPAGNPIFRDDPHGDWAWAGSLALFGLKRMLGDSGFRDVSSIFEPYAQRRLFERTPPGIDPPRGTPIPRGRILGQTMDGQPYLIKLPTNSCPYGDQRSFSNPDWLDLHVRTDHPQEWLKQHERKETDD